MDDLLKLPYYIRFAEDGDDDSGGDDGGSDSGDQDENDDNDDDTDDDAEDDSSGKNVEGLKSALAKERASRRNFEKQAKQLQREKEAEANKKKTDVEQATDRATKAETKATKLAAAFKDNAVNTAIIQASTGPDLTPVDIEDVLALVDRSGFDVEQDEDDPADVKIDKETVKTALKALKKKKPHLFAKKNADDDDEEDSGSRSGSTVGSRERRTPKNANEDQLRARYPALKTY